jgi:hypothetical protein
MKLSPITIPLGSPISNDPDSQLHIKHTTQNGLSVRFLPDQAQNDYRQRFYETKVSLFRERDLTE